MIDKIKFIFFSFILIFLFSGCSPNLEKYQKQYLVYFDTYSTFTAYTNNEEEFNKYSDIVEGELKKYHQYFDIYNEYSEINNIKTINDNAGVKAVEVDREILNLISDCKLYYDKTDGAFNIALGSVLKLWHEQRIFGIENPKQAKLPNMEELKKAAENISMDNVVIDEENSTVFIIDENTSLDLGAVAKGYTAEKIAQKLREQGLNSAILNLGGNVCTIGKPFDKEKWSIGVQSSNEKNESVIADKIFVNDMAVVSSGDYQRYYTVNGKNYHHIIDFKTLMPADEFKAVTVIHENSEIADMLSTSLFILPYDEGEKLTLSYGAEAVWYYKNGDIKETEGYKLFKKEY